MRYLLPRPWPYNFFGLGLGLVVGYMALASLLPGLSNISARLSDCTAVQRPNSSLRGRALSNFRAVSKALQLCYYVIVNPYACGLR